MKELKNHAEITHVEIEEHVYCPNCGTGEKNSQFTLVCRQCHKEFKKHENVICVEEYGSGNKYSHYHVDCYYEKINENAIKGVLE